MPTVNPRLACPPSSKDDPSVRSQVSQIHARLDSLESEAASYRKQFCAYEYLWATDLQAMFQGFLE